MHGPHLVPTDWQSQGVEIVRGALDDPDAIARAVADADVVYHLAARVDAPGSKADFLDANVGGTERVLTACLRHGVGRVIYASSLAVYGPIASGECIDENTAYDASPQLRDAYAESKILAEQFVVSFARSNRLPIAIVRPGIFMGRASHCRSDYWDSRWAGTTLYLAIVTITFR